METTDRESRFQSRPRDLWMVLFGFVCGAFAVAFVMAVAS